MSHWAIRCSNPRGEVVYGPYKSKDVAETIALQALVFYKTTSVIELDEPWELQYDLDELATSRSQAEAEERQGRPRSEQPPQ